MTQFMYINPAMKRVRTISDGNGGNITLETKIREQEIAKLNALKEQGFTIIGLEMTVPPLAELCDRNIDPQHTEGKAEQSCAKEVAEKAPELLGWFKGKDLDKVVFVTNRVDLDSVAAYVMADRYLKGEKVSFNENVAAINAHDTHLGAKWEGPKPIEQAFDPESKTGALASSIQVFNVTPDNIQNVANFIDTGMVDDCIMARFRASQQTIIAKVKSGEIKVKTENGVAHVVSSDIAATNVGYSKTPVVVAENPVMRASVESLNPEVLKIANSMDLTDEERKSISTYEKIAKEAGMPATVKENYTYRKVSICQHEGGYIDLAKACAELNKREVEKKIELKLLPEDCIEAKKAEIRKTKPDVSEDKLLEETYRSLGGWGGSPTFIGSPQGQDCHIDSSEIKKIVSACLTPEYNRQVIAHKLAVINSGKGLGK